MRLSSPARPRSLSARPSRSLGRMISRLGRTVHGGVGGVSLCAFGRFGVWWMEDGDGDGDGRRNGELCCLMDVG